VIFIVDFSFVFILPSASFCLNGKKAEQNEAKDQGFIFILPSAYFFNLPNKLGGYFKTQNQR